LRTAHESTTFGIAHIGGAVMLRLSIAAALVILTTSAFAQTEAVKDIKFGVGCIGPVSKYADRLGTCSLDDAKARIWCPNGEIFDRVGAPPQSFVVRSICNLNQIQ
jgi:hypothetical protein